MPCNRLPPTRPTSPASNARARDPAKVRAAAASRGVNASREPPRLAIAADASRVPPEVATRAATANRGTPGAQAAVPARSRRQRPPPSRRPPLHSPRACPRSVVRNRGAPSATLNRSPPITRIFRRSCFGRFAPAS